MSVKENTTETDQTEIVEDSVAMDTLKPASRSVTDDPKSKVEHITSMIGAMHGMKKDDLTKWFKEAMALIGKETSGLPGSANEKSNMNTLNMKPSGAVGSGGASSNDPMVKLDDKNNPLARSISVKEDVEDMLSGQDLSEEFREKATTIFEAAIAARSIVEIARLEEEFETKLEEEIKEFTKALETQVDIYLDFVVEKWLTDNEIAIESTLRNEVMKEFIGGLKTLFSEHYINIPEEKVDVIESLSSKVAELEKTLNETIVENVDLKKGALEVERVSVLESFKENLTLNESEKFDALSEGVEFDGDLKTYAKKLSYVKETYFTNKTKGIISNIEEETFEGDITEEVISYDPSVNKYAAAISRTVKN
jgi:hypothetical protein